MAGFAIPLAISGISALAGLFGGGKKANTSTVDNTTNTSGTSQSVQDINQSSMPTYEDGGAMKNALLAAYMNQASKDPNLTGYTGQGIRSINDSFDLKNKALQSILAARGLTYSPVGASIQAGNENSRISQGVNFMNQVPLLRDQINSQHLNDFGNFFKGLPVGNTITGHNVTNNTANQTAHTTGTQVGPHSATAGFLSGLGAGIGQGVDYYRKNKGGGSKGTGGIMYSGNDGDGA